MTRYHNDIVIPETAKRHSGIQNASRSLAALLLGSAALLFAPPAALAQVDPDCTGSNPGTVECPGPDDGGMATYADGITHTTNGGDLTVNVGDGVLSLGTGGFSTIATGSDSIVMTKGVGEMSTTDTTASAILNAETQDGDIAINVTNDSATTETLIRGASATTDYGIRAHSSGAGDIDIDLISTGAANVSRISVGGGVAGIEAVSNGGDINLNALATEDSVGFSGAAAAILQTSGSGGITIDVEGVESNLVSMNGGVFATTEAGDIRWITAGRTSGDLNAVSQTGDIDIDGSGSFDLQTDGLMTIDNNNAGSVTVTSASGNRLVVNMTGQMQGSLPTEDYNSNVVEDRFDFGDQRSAQFLDLSGLAGGAEIEFGSHTTWVTTTDLGTFSNPILVDSRLSDAADVVTTAEHSLVYGLLRGDLDLREDDDVIDPDRYGVDFGGGDDVFNMGGLLLAGSGESNSFARRSKAEGEYRFENLETFNLLPTGTIYLGTAISLGTAGDKLPGTDLYPDDILAMPGTHWHGEGGRILMDVNLNSTVLDGQESCDTAQIGSVRAANGDLPSSDCIDLTGGQATGRSYLVINQLIPGDRGAYNPDGFVVVDVSGSSGENDPFAFGISPDSVQYSDAVGEAGAVDKGLFVYVIGYDAEAEQYRLVGIEGPGSQQLPLMPHAVHNLWRESTAGWFERQGGDRHIGGSAELGGGFWARVSRESADHDLMNTVLAGTTPFEFDNSYEQHNTTLTLGLDLIDRHDEGDGWLAGVMLGYARAETDFDASANRVNYEGPSVGAYASYVAGPLFVDAAINGTWLDARSRVPAFQLTPEGTKLTTDIESLGGQVEAGWELAFGRFGVTPLLGASYVSSEFDDISVPASDPARLGGNLQFEDPSSLRAGLGVRLSADDLLPGGAVRTDASLTARAMNESDGESKVVVENIGPIPANVENTFDGSFTQVDAALSFSNRARTAVGYLGLDGEFGDDYESVGVSAGFRYQW